MTARDIQRSLLLDRYRRNLCCPNYTPNRWWECDVFELTASGFFVEYEIKLTRSDFKADAMKVKRHWNGAFDRDEKKHDLLAAADVNGPSRFYYVVPEGLIEQSELPLWAGLITCTMRSAPSAKFPVIIKEAVKAPRLHKRKLNEQVATHVRSIFYYRFMNLLLWKNISGDEAEPVVDLAPEAELVT